jgi:hypothetical protein
MKLLTGCVDGGINIVMLNDETNVKLNRYVPVTVLPEIDGVTSVLVVSLG